MPETRKRRLVRAAFFMRLVRHGPAVEMPGRVPEHGQDDEKPQEKRDRRGDHAERHEDAPAEHDEGALQHRLHGGDHGGDDIDVALEQERNREDGDREEDHRQHSTDDMAQREEEEPLLRGEDDRHELLEGGKGDEAETERDQQADLIHPDPEDEEHYEGHPGNLATPLRPDDGEDVAPGGTFARGEAAAYLVEADGGKRPDQRKTDGEGED